MLRASLALAASLGVVFSGCCQERLPNVTGVTISAADAAGNPDPIVMARTLLEPPIPMLTLRPGSHPGQSAMAYNHPVNGRVSVRLARGKQGFVLFAPRLERDGPFVVAIFLDNETTPALSAILPSSEQPLAPSRAATIMGLQGRAVGNTSALQVQRRRYSIRLEAAQFPLPGVRYDVAAPWSMHGDNLPDSVGVFHLIVEPAA